MGGPAAGASNDLAEGSSSASEGVAAIEDLAEGSSSTLVRVPEWLEQESTMILETFLVSIFFASAGFIVEVEVLLNPSTVLLGLLCATVAMLAKLVAGVWCRGYRLCVGL